MTSKPTLDPRHRKTLQILALQGIAVRILIRQDLVQDDSWVDNSLLSLAGCVPKEIKRDHKKVRSTANLGVSEIADCISVYQEKNGTYPNRNSGQIEGHGSLTWSQVDAAMKKGSRGLPRMGSLQKYISEQYNVRHPKHLPPLPEESILALAVSHFDSFGQWPTARSKTQVPGQMDTWQAIASALNVGARGLPGGDSLGALLRRNGCQGVRTVGRVLSIEDIVFLAREHYGRTGNWPAKKMTGPINGEVGLNWRNIDKALRDRRQRIKGIEVFAAKARSLTKGQMSLAALLFIFCAVESHIHKHILEPEVIMAAADQFRRINGRWPSQSDKSLIQGLGSTILSWNGLAQRLRHGYCEFPGGSSLRELFQQYRPDDPFLNGIPTVTYGALLKLIRAHKKCVGSYPQRNSGIVNGFQVLTWETIDDRLRAGSYPLPKGGSLARLLEKEFGSAAPPNRGNRESMRLSVPQVADCLRDFVNQNGRFPNRHDGAVGRDKWLSWGKVISSMNSGTRGLPKGSLGSFARGQGIVRPARPDRPA